MPGLLIAFAAAAGGMAAALTMATLVGGVIDDDTGRALARLFAAALAIAGGLLFAMAVLWLNDDRGNSEHYWAPAFIGAVVGVAEAWLFLAGFTGLLWLPPLFLVLALRPVRHAAARILRRGSQP